MAQWLAGKTSAVGRLILLSGLGGVLVAAMALPVVASTGILARNTADKFTTLPLNASGLPQRSEILDRTGHLITYVYGVDLGPGMKYTRIDRQPVAYSRISPSMRKAIAAIEPDLLAAQSAGAGGDGPGADDGGGTSAGGGATPAAEVDVAAALRAALRVLGRR